MEVSIDKDRLQELEMIEELFHKSIKKLKPLEDLWRKDNKEMLQKEYGKHRVEPDYTELIKWSFKKIKNTMKGVKIKIKLLEGGVMPKKATEDAVCYDVFAREIEITSNRDKAIVYLGFATEIPKGWKGVLVPRSSQNKTHWTMLNVPGQIDGDFRGEWQFRLTSIPKSKNSLSQPFTIDYTTEIFPFQVGDRVAQIYFEEVTDVEFEQVEELSETERGSGGFGSTGK